MIRNSSHSILLAFMAAGLLAMLGTSLWQRFSHPSLTVHRFEQRAERPASDMGDMGGIGQLMQTVSRNPSDMAALLKLIESLMAMGQWDGAENFAQKAMAIDPGSDSNRRAMYLLAVIHHNKGNHAQAADLLEKLLEQGENPSARYSLGILYLHFLDRRDAGLEQLRKGLEAPDLPPGLAEAIAGELDKAEMKTP